jgi:hypothetical protein
MGVMNLKMSLGVVPAVALALGVAWSSCAGEVTTGSTQSARRQLDEFFGAVPHATFEWSEAEGVSDRGAMLVPVQLGSIETWLQLDSGLDVTLLYGDLAEDAGWSESDRMFRVPDLSIGDVRLGPTWVRTDRSMSGGGRVAGSVGLDLLVGRVVIIDYPGRRLALATLGDLPGELLRRVSWSPATLRDGKLFPYVILSGSGTGDLFFDTGASAFALVVDQSTWAALTGVADPDTAAVHVDVRSWGKETGLVGHPASGPLVIGSTTIEEVEVFYFEDQPRMFEAWPFPAKGLLGNAAFFDRVVVLDLGLRPRFGLLDEGARPN